MPERKRLLIVTDHHYVSALLFHGFGLPPWYDLPLIQEKRSFRAAMTRRVNRVIAAAAPAGFDAFDVHEAFPVDLMSLAERARLLRGIDRFLTQSRRYAGYALLSLAFAWGIGIQKPGAIWKAWLLTVAYAVTDEFHQSFVPGRNASLMDVVIDALGASIGLIPVVAFRKLSSLPEKRPE